MAIRGWKPTLLTLFLAAGAARAAIPPLSYPESSDVAEIQATVLGSTPGVYGVTLTVADGADPSLSRIDIWEQRTDGTFVERGSSTVPDLVAHFPVEVGSTQYDDLFYLTYGGGQVQCGLIPGAGGTYDPTGSVIVSYPQGIAPPKGRVIAAANNLNGTPGGDVAVLVSGELVYVFLDDGSGGLDPAYQTVPLPAGTNANAIDLADVTGDGLPDLLAGSVQGGTITVMENTSSGSGPLSFASLQVVSVSGLRAFGVADMNGDGTTWCDLVAIRTSGSQGELLAMMNQGSSTPFGPMATTQVDDGPVALAMGDLLPADGDRDLFVACQSSGYGTLVELTNDGTGVFQVTGKYLSTATVQNASGADRFVGLEDPQAGLFTIFPMDPWSPNVSPADEVAVGAGPDPNASAEVLVFRGDGTPVTTASVIPYASTYGVRVGNGNVDGTETLHAKDELLTGPGPSPAFGPHVRAFSRIDLALAPIAKVSFYAYGTLRAGVNVVGPDVDVDQSDEIVTGAGPNQVFGPHVRGFNYDGVALAAIAKINFFAYGTLKYGVEVGGGFDGDADDFDEILTGPGPGPVFGAQVRGFNYDDTLLTAMAKVSFIAMGAPFGYGCNVTGGDVDNDAIDEIQVARGPGPSQAAELAGFNYDGIAVAELPGFRITPFNTMYGGNAGHGDLGGDLEDEQDEVIVGQGADAAADATLKVFLYAAGALQPGPVFATHMGTAYGAHPGGVYFGF